MVNKTELSEFGPERQGIREYVASPGDARELLLVDGWAIASDHTEGFDPTFREHAVESIFAKGRYLTLDPYGVPPHDRLQARAAIDFEYVAGNEVPLLRQRPIVTVGSKKHYLGERDYEAVPVLDDPRFQSYVEHMMSHFPVPLGLDAPKEEIEYFIANEIDMLAYFDSSPADDNPYDSYGAQEGIQGTIVLHFFETKTEVVVSGFHQDNTHLGVIDVLEHEGGGGTSALRWVGQKDPFIVYTLKEGQKLFMDDRRVEHTGTALVPKPNADSAYRRTIVWNVDFHSGMNIDRRLVSSRAVGRLSLPKMEVDIS